MKSIYERKNSLNNSLTRGIISLNIINLLLPLLNLKSRVDY